MSMKLYFYRIFINLAIILLLKYRIITNKNRIKNIFRLIRNVLLLI